jgi:hypothetical protein
MVAFLQGEGRSKGFYLPILQRFGATDVFNSFINRWIFDYNLKVSALAPVDCLGGNESEANYANINKRHRMMVMPARRNAIELRSEFDPNPMF